MPKKLWKSMRTAEIAESLGRDPSTVRRWAAEGCPHRKDGRDLIFDLSEVWRWYEATYLRQDEGREVQTRLLRARADLVEAKAGALRAESVPIADVRRTWEAMLAELRRRTVAWVPKMAHATVAAAPTYPAQKVALDDAVRGLLTELSETDPRTAR